MLLLDYFNCLNLRDNNLSPIREFLQFYGGNDFESIR